MIEEIKPFLMKILLLLNDIKSLAQKATTLTLQLMQNGIDTVILAGMDVANLCVDLVMRTHRIRLQCREAARCYCAPGEEAYQAAQTTATLPTKF